DSWEVTDDSLPRHGRESQADNVFAFQITLAFKQHKEKRLVLDDGSTDPRAILVPIVVAFRHAIRIVEPGTRIQRRVVVHPECASVKLIGAGAGDHTHLP